MKIPAPKKIVEAKLCLHKWNDDYCYWEPTVTSLEDWATSSSLKLIKVKFKEDFDDQSFVLEVRRLLLKEVDGFQLFNFFDKTDCLKLYIKEIA
jgi:hypothetical protein